MNRTFVKPLIKLVVFCMVILLGIAGSPRGWNVSAQTSEVRKVKTKVDPEYPDFARKLHIKGLARVQITITPQGSVSLVKQLGGNPVLLETLVRAVTQWKFEPANRESVMEVRYDFI